jgi:tetratricopeptide (TPR) repeat protein
MIKNILLTLVISIFSTAVGFSNSLTLTAADVLHLSVNVADVSGYDTITRQNPSASTSVKKTPVNNTKTHPTQDTINKNNKTSLGKPKMLPIVRMDPFRPPQLKEGLEKAQNGDLHGAIILFDTCIKKNYKNFNAYFYKAKALIELKEPEEAMKNLNLAIQYNPRNALFFYYRGKLSFDTGHKDEAYPDFDTAIILRHDFVDALNYRGVIKAERGHQEEAIKDYDLAISYNKDYATAYYNKGTSEAALEKYKEAIASFSKCVELDPQKAMGFMNRGNCYVMLKDYTSAITDYTQVISLSPENSDAYYNRGAAYQFMDDKNACNDWQKAESLGNKKAVEMLKEYCK